METQATESPHLPEHHHTSLPAKPKLKLNKYLIAIIILAILFAIFFYFKPHGEVKAPEITEKEQPLLNETPEIPEIPVGELLDVSVVNVILPTSTAIKSPFSFSFDINNTMNKSIDEASLNVKLDDAVVYSKAVEDLAVNTTANFGFTFLSGDEFYPEPGEHTVTILLNGHSIYEKDFTMTERTIAPNLEVRTFSSAPVTGIKADEEVTLTAYVRNVGSADATNASVKFYVNGNLIDTQTADIAQQITTPFKVTWTPTEAGDYALKVTVDIANDPYLDNNEYSMNVTVGNSTG